jgi:hypothetical protein
VRDAWVKKYRFHDYRNTALTDWARRGVNVDIAMKASGHTSVQMHKRYLDLQREDVAKAFGLLQDGNTDNDEEEVESQVVDFREGEGRCPVVPLVFKTSLGVVRSPEGSTPSLLRQNPRDQQLRHGQDRSRQLLILKRLAKGKKTVVELDQLHLFIIPIGRRNLHPLTF